MPPKHSIQTFIIDPQITHAVTRYLSNSQVIACIRVCRLWKEVFQPCLYRNLMIRESRHLPSAEQVLQNAHQVISLQMGLVDDLALQSALLHCTDLKFLDISFCQWTHTPSAAPAPGEFITQLLDANRGIDGLYLKIDCCERGAHTVIASLLPRLERLHSLKTLHFSCNESDFQPEIATHLPPSVENLSFSYTNLCGIYHPPIDKDPVTLERPLGVQKLEVCYQDTKSYRPSIASLLKRCPSLRLVRITAQVLDHGVSDDQGDQWSGNVTEDEGDTWVKDMSEETDGIVHTLIDHCSSSLEQLILVNVPLGRLALARLVRSCPRFQMVTSFCTNKSYTSVGNLANGFLPPLLPLSFTSHLSSTQDFSSQLTVVRVAENEVYCQVIPTLVSTCRHLKELSVLASIPSRQVAAPTGGASLQELACITWVCTDLHTLHLPVIARPTSTVESLTLILDQKQLSKQEMTGFVVALLLKLRLLKKLHWPFLRWNPVQDFEILFEVAQVYTDREGYGYQITQSDVRFLGIPWTTLEEVKRRTSLGYMCLQAEYQHPGLHYTSCVDRVEPPKRAWIARREWFDGEEETETWDRSSDDSLDISDDDWLDLAPPLNIYDHIYNTTWPWYCDRKKYSATGKCYCRRPRGW